MCSIDGMSLAAKIRLQEAPRAICFSHDGDNLAILAERSLEVWQMSGGGLQRDRIVFSKPLGGSELGFIGNVAFSEDDRLIMAVSDINEVDRLWLWQSGDLIEEVCSYVSQLGCRDRRGGP